MPTTFRWFGLKRKQECDSCKACAKGCGSNWPSTEGNIDPRECMLCLDCMVLYTTRPRLPAAGPGAQARTRAGLPLTPIGADGYFIPIKRVPGQPAQP
jgi:NosR/NirI family nitrous oxide reductase transcriptional regulator